MEPDNARGALGAMIVGITGRCKPSSFAKGELTGEDLFREIRSPVL